MKKQLLNKALRILLSTNAVILFAVAMFGPIYAIYVERIGGDLMDAGFAVALYALAGGITTIVSGRYSDKIKENELIVVAGYLIMAGGFLAYVFIDSVLQLFIVQMVIGLGEAIYAPAFDALYSKHLDGKRSGSQWGAWESTNYFTAAIGAAVGGFVAAQFGFNRLFILMAALSLASAIYIYLLPRKVL